MRLAIVTIQRNRGKWLSEWFAFHHLQGVDRFIFYAHRCDDETPAVIAALGNKVNITAYSIPDNTERPQLAAYNHAYRNHGHESDWFAFIDGDEFLFTTDALDLKASLQEYQYKKISAVGVYWACFGSNGHLKEPAGLITQNYTRRAPLDAEFNRHIKSIVRGHQGAHFQAGQNAHLFSTIYGTFDEIGRPINSGISEHAPSTTRFRINHYVCQSREFYEKFKRSSGAADAGANVIRPETWWEMHDRNDEQDYLLARGSEKIEAFLSQNGSNIV
ncbi:MAG: glycosyl transferase [Actinobacteria bacterium]|nr:glycosyl transferase [Actinomycetota bacterium]